MKVVQITRKPTESTFSVEHLFDDVRKGLSGNITVEVYINPYLSKGLWRRLLGMFDVMWHQGDVNHIVGDVHFLSIFLRRRKTILTILDCVTLERLSGLRYKVFRFLWYWLPAKRSAVITVISESTKKELLRHLGEGDWPVFVVPCQVSQDYHYFPKKFVCKYPVILQVGTKENKNVERVALALKGLKCRLVVIGKLSSNQIKTLNENAIDFENHVGISLTVLVQHYRKCDIVMFASLYEGFGLPILEGQATGRPVITSNIYSMPEVGGDGACYVDPYSVAEIRAAVLKLVRDDEYRENLIGKGCENVKKYSLSSVVMQYAKLYREVYSANNSATELAN